MKRKLALSGLPVYLIGVLVTWFIFDPASRPPILILAGMIVTISPILVMASTLLGDIK